jgi:hypothetical protein
LKIKVDSAAPYEEQVFERSILTGHFGGDDFEVNESSGGPSSSGDAVDTGEGCDAPAAEEPTFEEISRF